MIIVINLVVIITISFNMAITEEADGLLKVKISAGKKQAKAAEKS